MSRCATGSCAKVREETGAEIEVVELLDLFEPIHRDATGAVRYHYVVIDFWAHFRGGAVAPADDADEAEWVSLERLDELPMEDATRPRRAEGPRPLEKRTGGQMNW